MGQQYLQGGGRNKETAPASADDTGTEEYDEMEATIAEWGRYYPNLVRGYLETVVKWQNILETEGHEPVQGARTLEVFATPDGPQIGKPGEVHDPNDKILEMQSEQRDLWSAGHILSLTATPGPAGKSVFIDLDGKPIREAKIEIHYQSPREQTVEITSVVPSPYYPHASNDKEITRGIFFDLLPGYPDMELYPGWFPMRVGSGHNDNHIMLDEYATHLLNTIDTIISGATSHIPQNGRRATPEMQLLKALPAPGRRATGR